MYKVITLAIATFIISFSPVLGDQKGETITIIGEPLDPACYITMGSKGWCSYRSGHTFLKPPQNIIKTLKLKWKNLLFSLC